MAEVTALVGKLRGEDPPPEPYHSAVARRKERAELRKLAAQQATESQDGGAGHVEANGPGGPGEVDGAGGTGDGDGTGGTGEHSAEVHET